MSKATFEWDEKRTGKIKPNMVFPFGLHNRLFLILNVLLQEILLIAPKKTGITVWDVSAKVF